MHPGDTGVAQWRSVSRDPGKRRGLDTLSAPRVTTWAWLCLPWSERGVGEYSATQRSKLCLLFKKRHLAIVQPVGASLHLILKA